MLRVICCVSEELQVEDILDQLTLEPDKLSASHDTLAISAKDVCDDSRHAIIEELLGVSLVVGNPCHDVGKLLNREKK